MNCLIAVKFDKFVMIAGDMMDQHSVLVMRDNDDKLMHVTDKLIMGIVGEKGDTDQFAEYISRNLQLYRMRHGYPLGVKASAHFTRKQLADALRTREAYQVNLLLAGYDDQDGPSVHFIDYLASSVEVPYAVHGYGGMMSVSILDRYYRENMNQEEAYELLKKCVQEVQKRLIISCTRFAVKTIDENGIRNLPVLDIKKIE